MDRGEFRPTRDLQRCRTAVALPFDSRAHFFQGKRDAVHGAFTQGLVPYESCFERLRGENPRKQPHRRAAIPAIDRFAGICKLPATAVDSNVCAIVPQLLDFHAHCREGIHCRETILTRQKSGDLAGPIGKGGKHQSPMGNALVSGHGEFGGEILYFFDSQVGHNQFG